MTMDWYSLRGFIPPCLLPICWGIQQLHGTLAFFLCTQDIHCSLCLPKKKYINDYCGLPHQLTLSSNSLEICSYWKPGYVGTTLLNQYSLSLQNNTKVSWFPDAIIFFNFWTLMWDIEFGSKSYVQTRGMNTISKIYVFIIYHPERKRSKISLKNRFASKFMPCMAVFNNSFM